VLQVADKTPDTSDQISFKWNAGSTTRLSDLGDPVHTDDYALCLYAGAGSTLIFKAMAPAGGTCGAGPCWKQVGTTGFKYGRKDGAPEGAVQIQLKAVGSGTSKASFKGKGVYLSGRPLGLPAPPLATPVRAQIQGANGVCFNSTFGTSFPPATNKPGSFKSKSD
jgi:hypothetical protein